mgnify:CR=1 FL=1
MNKNYLAGRRFEYEVKAYWMRDGFETIRASGSHGEYDVVAYRLDRKPAFIQCKRVKESRDVALLLKKFQKNTISSAHYHQILAVKVKGENGFHTALV